jgi:hypothetical protein
VTKAKTVNLFVAVRGGDPVEVCGCDRERVQTL